jgi:peptidyl-prolyl cis-trans isomerase C
MISVNGVIIEEEAVAREMQQHPAATRDEAQLQAGRALVVRELLLQRARALDVDEVSEDERIAQIINRDIQVPEATDEEIARYYRRNTLRFMTSPLYEAAHIFFPARAGDETARSEAKAKAEAVLAMVLAEAREFAALAGTYSACSSKEQGGSLGQVTKGDTNPELERAMAAMDEGTIDLVCSRHGFHVLRLDRRQPAKQIPLEQAKPWIENRLRTTAKRSAIAQYLKLLAGQAKITGIDLAGADSPLVQ